MLEDTADPNPEVPEESYIFNPEESNLVQHAIRELNLRGDDPEDVSYIVDMITLFAKQGHSGSSAGYSLATLVRLLQFENLTALTDDPKEWNYVGDGVWQASRNSEAFSLDGGKTYYLLSEEHGNGGRHFHNSKKKEVTDA